jgi:hypothetical protein
MTDRIIKPREYITLSRKYSERDSADTSALAVHDNELQVVGILPHGSRIQPASLGDAADLLLWLALWINTELSKK